MEIRKATIDDAQAIADIHVNSWRATYSNALTKDYLQDVVPKERQQIWRERFCSPKPNQYVVVAEVDGHVIGFACAYVGENPRWGSYLDNSHVVHAHQGRGVGKALMQVIAGYCYEQEPGGGLCLLVNQDNVRAQKVYSRLGARNAEESVWNAPDGSIVPTYWFVWDGMEALLATGQGQDNRAPDS